MLDQFPASQAFLLDLEGMLIRTSIAALALCAIAATRVACGQVPSLSGEKLFQDRCSGCHDGAPEARAPAPEVLRQRSAAAILEALANGAMRVQGATLSGPERRAIAEYLGGTTLTGDPTGASRGRCATFSTFSMSGPDGTAGAPA
jgi:hypothetical protein